MISYMVEVKTVSPNDWNPIAMFPMEEQAREEAQNWKTPKDNHTGNVRIRQVSSRGYKVQARIIAEYDYDVMVKNVEEARKKLEEAKKEYQLATALWSYSGASLAAEGRAELAHKDYSWCIENLTEKESERDKMEANSRYNL